MSPRVPLGVAVLATLVVAPCIAAAQANGATPPADVDPGHREVIRVGYHEPSGHGTLELRPMIVGKDPTLRLHVMTYHKGKQLTVTPAGVSIALNSVAPAPRFPDTPTLVILLDGGRREEISGMVRQVERSDSAVRETIAHRIPTAAFLRIARSTSVVGRVGEVQFSLEPEQLAALRDFASRLTPAGYAAGLQRLTATGRVGDLVVRTETYEGRDVDIPARLILSGFTKWPEGVPRADGGRAVRLIFVVDSTGRIEPGSVVAADPANDAPFAESLRATCSEWEFEPARKDGRPVRQIVRQIIRF